LKCGDPPLTKLAEDLCMDRTTLTRNLKPLLAKGWISATQDQDHRVRRIALTGSGRQVLDTALPLWRVAQSKLVGKLGPKRWSGFLDDLSETVVATKGR
jgi:DNA-binding MarR family transcriptional regulator